MSTEFDKFMADRGHPYMTPSERESALKEWVSTHGCRAKATVEIRPNAGGPEDYTHSCDEHVGAMLGHHINTPAPAFYEVRPIADAEHEPHLLHCCHVARSAERQED